MYDVNDPTSFDNVVKHLKRVEEYCDGNVVQVIVGNKNDLEHKVETKEAEHFSSERGIPFFETSAKLGSNIQDVFDCILDLVKQDSNILYKNQKPNVSGMKESPKTESSSGRWCNLG
jgi:Ras-related protein Rab-8A